MRRVRGHAISGLRAALAAAGAYLIASAAAAEPATQAGAFPLEAGDALGWQLFGDPAQRSDVVSGAEIATPHAEASEPIRAELLRWLLESGEREARWNQQQPR